MNKAISILGLMLVVALASVSATIPDGFFLNKEVLVTGDWAWDGDSWNLGNYPTASFEIDTDSWTATAAMYGEEETLGNAWKYDLKATTQVNSDTRFRNTLNAVTVNPPTTTPGTAWTHIKYNEITAGDFSTSGLTINGYGNVLVSSLSHVLGESIQQVEVHIN